MASITEGDRGVIRNHLGALLPLPLSKVTTKVIDQHYTRLTKNERSPQVVFRVHRILGAAFRQGEKWGDIKHSPVRNVTAPRVPVVEVEATPIDVLHTLIDSLVAEGQLDAAAFCWIAILTGMRRGEILRLQWRDLDRERGAVSQRRTIVKEADVPVVKEGSKTGRGRVIELTDLLAGVLEGQRERMATRALLASGKLADDGFVFSFDPIGATPARPDWITKLLGRWSKRNGVRVHPHGFRHTFISGALLSGIDLVRVSAVAGQSKAATTFRYAHVISPSTDAVDAVAALVRRAS